MILSFHPCIDADAQVILGVRTLDSSDLKWVRKADAIILPQGKTHELYKACSGSKARIFPNYEMRFKYPGKIGQALLCRDYGCMHPQTLIWNTVKEFTDAHPDPGLFPHELPFFIKKDKGHEAEGVYLVEESASLSKALSFLARLEAEGQKGFITQDAIPCRGNVLRAVIIGKQFITYWKRPERPGQNITTISRGAIIDHDWRPDLQKKATAQTEILAKETGINLAAIDFVFPIAEKDPDPLFLEINYYFGRRGLGGTEKYYHLLYKAIQVWLHDTGLDPQAVKLI
ncbi:MAG: hypothetical protein ISS61_02950 [Desulfobacteraceae bacterium]|nr:hypothetical protein [Desulfobacteraceae bacterium]